MSSIRRSWAHRISSCILAVVVVVPVSLFAETAHVVSSSDLTQQAVAASQVRQHNEATVRNFLSNPVAAQAMQKTHVDIEKVKGAIATLNDQELAELAARADKAQHDFAAGYLSTRDIALIILGVALLILIIIVAR